MFDDSWRNLMHLRFCDVHTNSRAVWRPGQPTRRDSAAPLSLLSMNATTERGAQRREDLRRAVRLRDLVDDRHRRVHVARRLAYRQQRDETAHAHLGSQHGLVCHLMKDGQSSGRAAGRGGARPEERLGDIHCHLKPLAQYIGPHVVVRARLVIEPLTKDFAECWRSQFARPRHAAFSRSVIFRSATTRAELADVDACCCEGAEAADINSSKAS